MTYEIAPATSLLATHCCFCSRPLLDATSVQRGYGPICAEKWFVGYDLYEPAVRQEINGLIHEAAAIQRDEPARISEIVQRLRELRADVAADRIAEQLLGKATVEIAVEGDRLAVCVYSFNDEWVNQSRAVPGRRCEKRTIEGKVRWVSTFPVEQKRALWACLQRTLSGSTAVGPKGAFVI